MSTRLLSEHPFLIGQLLARSERRTQRRRRLRRILGTPLRLVLSALRRLRVSAPRIARISPTEVIHSHAPLN